jgi:hypothetical protein
MLLDRRDRGRSSGSRINATVNVRNNSEASSAYRSTQLYICRHRAKAMRIATPPPISRLLSEGEPSLRHHRKETQR